MIHSKYYLQFLIALNTGMRMGEINALHYNDIDLINRTISVNKTVSRDVNYIDFINTRTKTNAGTRIIQINSILYGELSNFIKDKKDMYLFSNDTIISTGQVSSALKRLLKNNTISSHVLRHTFATRCIEAGVPAVALKKFLGHEDISNTLNTYVDVFDKFEKDVYNIIDNYLNNL